MTRKQLIRVAVAALVLAIGAIGVARAEEKQKEEKVALKDVPAAVKKTIEEKAKDAKIEEIEKKTKDSKVTYEVKIEKDEKHREFYVAEDGKFLGWEDEKKCKHEEGKHGEKEKHEHEDEDNDKD
jgi:ABC-type Na+ efflux pump permease subunit